MQFTLQVIRHVRQLQGCHGSLKCCMAVDLVLSLLHIAPMQRAVTDYCKTRLCVLH